MPTAINPDGTRTMPAPFGGTRDAPAATGRPLALRRRADLVTVRQSLAGRTFWAVKDPLTLRYFHLSDEEHCVLESLDGLASLEEIQERFERHFAPRRLSLQHLHSFLGLLHQEGLIVVDAPGQADELLQREQTARRRRLLAALSNVLAIRFPGVDPQPFLEWLLPKVRWLFSYWAFAAAAILVLSAIVVVAAHWDALRAQLTGTAFVSGTATVFWLAVALAITKMLHELGHALACRQFGGECHEMGFMLLVFTPCLYCNVSDAWMIESKWRRATIGAAGVCVELVLAALGAFGWLWSEPGLFNTLSLNVMLVSSLGTLLFNGNPLMRYDGYFVLSDLVEIPNLAQEAASVARDELAAWALGIPHRDGEYSRGRRAFLGLYAVASIVYRAAVLLGIFWLVHRLLKPYHLEVLALGLGFVVVGGLVSWPLLRAAQFVQNAWWSRQMKPRRALASAALCAALLGALLLTPLPHRIAAPIVLEPQDARRIFILVGGTLVEGVEIGSRVAAGDQIARLENLEIELEVARVRGERDRQKLHLETLRLRQSQQNEAAAQIPVAEEVLADLEDRLQQRLEDRARLILKAPESGMVLPGRRKPRNSASGEPAGWSGAPLEAINRGCYLEAGTLVCLVGDPARLDAALVLDQSDIEFVQPGQEVEIQLDQSPAHRLYGTVREVSELDLKVTPPELVPEGALSTRPDAEGVLRPTEAVYQARVSLRETDRPLLLGEAGQAKIHAGSLSLARRLWRTLSRTFRFEW